MNSISEEGDNLKLIEKAVENLSLSSREKEVAALLAQGQSNQEISAVLNISVNTVKFHIKNIYSKNGISNRWKFMFKINGIISGNFKRAINGRVRVSNH